MELSLTHIQRYSALQQRLLFALFNSIDEPLDEKNFRVSVPTTGSIVTNSKEWLYRRHGDGVFFTDGKSEVDAIKYIFTEPSGFEAWRLMLHYESIGENYSERMIGKLIQNWAAKGYLYKYPFRDFYVLNIGSFQMGESEESGQIGWRAR